MMTDLEDLIRYELRAEASELPLFVLDEAVHNHAPSQRHRRSWRALAPVAAVMTACAVGGGFVVANWVVDGRTEDFAAVQPTPSPSQPTIYSEDQLTESGDSLLRAAIRGTVPEMILYEILPDRSGLRAMVTADVASANGLDNLEGLYQDVADVPVVVEVGEPIDDLLPRKREEVE